MQIFIVNQENKAAMSALEKLSVRMCPGQVVALTADEFEAMTNGSVVPMSVPEPREEDGEWGVEL